MTLRRGEVLWSAGDRLDRLWFLDTGLVSTQATYGDGRQIECVLSGKNTVIGALSNAWLNTAITRQVSLFDSHGWEISVAPFSNAMRSGRNIERALSICCRNQVAFGISVGACNAVHRAEQRIARWLLLADKLMDGEPLPISQEQLSGIFASHRTLVNPMLRKWSDGGLVSNSRRQLQVLDHDGIMMESCSCYQILLKCTNALLPRIHGNSLNGRRAVL